MHDYKYLHYYIFTWLNTAPQTVATLDWTTIDFKIMGIKMCLSIEQ